jgi:hypothetical protein
MGEGIMDITIDGDGYGSGYGHGDGYGDGYGYGYGFGSGYDDGDGDGYGYGDGSFEFIIPEKDAFTAYHYITKDSRGYILRNGRIIQMGQTCEEDEIKMCAKGLHASMTPQDAKRYAPCCSILTEVLVWGRVVYGRDKLVATHRKLIKELN